MAITQDWRTVFPQQRTFTRAVRHAMGSLVCLGRRCLTRILWTPGGQNRRWSGEYFLYSRCRWDPQQLFQPILQRARPYCQPRLVGVALDDTRLRKTGRCIPQAIYQRDPLSPPFHVNLVLAGDGSFCNRTCFGDIPERSILLVRARKDAQPCFAAAANSRRFCATEKWTPEQVRRDENRAGKTTKIFYGGKRRKIRYKEVAHAYWQRGAGKRPVRLMVIALTAYRKSQSKRLYYRDPAYLLCSDLRSSAKRLLQIHFDRWQIEVNHRAEKDILGVGQAQLWNLTAVPKQPVFAVASYSALLLAALLAFGAERGKTYAALPKWRRKARRPSCLTSSRSYAKSWLNNPNHSPPWVSRPAIPTLVQGAAA